MEFTSLRDETVLQIFQYLPLEDQVRLGGVNKNFNRISQMAISKTLSEDKFEQLKPGQLKNLLDLCVNNLESIRIHAHGKNGLFMVMLSAYS